MASKKTHPPSVNETAFECPHCGAYTTQKWYPTYAAFFDNDRKKPLFPPDNFEENVNSIKDMERENKNSLIEWGRKVRLGEVFFDVQPHGNGSKIKLANVHISECYNCEKITIWVHDSIVYPLYLFEIEPDDDMPEDVKVDFIEANKISDLSPRGAAALLRLAIQKLCVDLGGQGNSINDDIKMLVKKGLPEKIQKALDIVRVIGNEAVHPGTLDIKDDRDTVNQLFDLVNFIVQEMISSPKKLDEIYGSLPESKRKAIEKRDGGK